MPVRWNQVSSSYAEHVGPVLDRRRALNTSAVYLIIAVAAACTSRFGTPWLVSSNLPYATAIGLLPLLVAGACSAAVLSVASRWREGRRRLKIQAGLGAQQRALLGLPPVTPARPLDPTRPAAAPVAPSPAAALSTPLARPQRAPAAAPTSGGRSLYNGTTPQSLLASAASTRSGRNPMSPGLRFTPASGGKAVATPDQLRSYIDPWTPHGPPAHPPPDDGLGAGAPYSDASAAAAASRAAGYDAGNGADGGGSVPLSWGSEAPLYHPSLLPRKVASSAAAAAGEALHPTAAAEAEGVVRHVLGEAAGPQGAAVPDLVVWTERFREWLSLQVFKPLVQLLDSCHVDVNRELWEQGERQTQLPPLRDVLGAGGDRGAGGGSSDPEATVRHLLGHCASLPYQQEKLRPLIKALTTYDALLALLRGRRPPDLLPPTPPAYLADRICALAAGTCLHAFTWNGGGRHQGLEWAPGELPTDSALVFYLFAAFMDAPGWQFGLGANGDSCSHGTRLFLGSMRPRPPPEYSALLAFRPDKPGPGAAAVIATALASQQPKFTLLVLSQLLTLAERDAVFTVLLLWLQYHARARAGLVGGVYLGDDALGGLADVLAPPSGRPSIPQRVFEWWFPPRG